MIRQINKPCWWGRVIGAGLVANPMLLGVGTGSTSGTFGYDVSQLRQQATYTAHGWDFTTVWTIDEGAGYAELR